MARKTREHQAGIGLLWALDEVPQRVADYLAVVRACNPAPKRRNQKPRLRWYPGSPLIARHFARSDDRLLLMELHPDDFPRLQYLFVGDRRIRVEQQDGYRALKALIPPPERRGLVLLDPAYERRDEVQRLGDAVLQGYRRWSSGCFMLWYPIMPKTAITPLYERLQTAQVRKVLRVELCLYPDDNPLGLNGSGVLIINPPWRCDVELGELLPWLWRTLGDGEQGRYRVDWLIPE
jgi:23S rRNA (adenine2030-N6)-methyltransferase